MNGVLATEVVRPGIVIIRNLLTHDEQLRIIEIVKKHGLWPLPKVKKQTFLMFEQGT